MLLCQKLLTITKATYLTSFTKGMSKNGGNRSLKNEWPMNEWVSVISLNFLLIF